MKSHLSYVLLTGLLTTVLAGCRHYRADVPTNIMQAPDTQIWGVAVQKTGSGYRIHSKTRFNGSRPLRGKPSSHIASGVTGTWRWEVRAVPSLLPSWKAWQSDKKIRKWAASPDDWSHPAATWKQGFERAYKVVDYLLGKTPPAMKLRVLLLPDGSTYDKTVIQTGDGFIPLTFAFYYPSDAGQTEMVMGERFSALGDAVAYSVYEYQHVMDDTGVIKLIGKDETDQYINDESRSHCWHQSTLLALASGTRTTVKWNPVPQALLERSSSHKATLESGKQSNGAQKSALPAERSFSDAVLWAKYVEARSISAYLKERGLEGATVLSNEPAAMNAVLSACRAMTQRPLDLTAGAYPPAQVEFVPFFPPSFSSKESKGDAVGKSE